MNKCDLNNDMADEIDLFCRRRGFNVVAKLPHDPVFVHAMVQCRSVTEYMKGSMARLIRSAWEEIEAVAAASARTMYVVGSTAQKNNANSEVNQMGS